MLMDDFINRLSRTKKFNKNPNCYIYDFDIIKKNTDSIIQYKPNNVKVFYAIKANPHDRILSYFKNLNKIDGFEVASKGELKKSLKHYDAQSILFTGPGKREEELAYAIKEQIKYINVESLVEAVRINNIAQKLGVKSVNILLRVNLNYRVKKAAENMGGLSSKLGIDEDDFEEVYKEVGKLSHITICGIHAYSASGILDYKVLLRYAKYVFKFVKNLQLKLKNIEIKTIDLGGGIGIDYTYKREVFDTKKYFKGLSGLIKDYEFENLEIVFELGCYLVGNAGKYISKIIDIKESKGFKHIILSGGLNHIPTATLNGKHPIYFIKMNEKILYRNQKNVKNEIVDIDGPLCTCEDKVIWNEYVDEANIGDLIVIEQAGAYCYSAAWLKFLSHDLPLEIFINEN